MKSALLFAMALLVVIFMSARVDDEIYGCNKGLVSFVSYAPLETIKATSIDLNGAFNATTRTFLFVVDVKSFHGFNSGLQQEHFNENYLETDLYPKVSFKGKVIEAIDFTEKGKYEVRAKGMLDIHGISQERIIKGTLTVDGNHLILDSKFSVLLEDHNIRIPRVVYQKIAPEITVTIHAEMDRVARP